MFTIPITRLATALHTVAYSISRQRKRHILMAVDTLVLLIAIYSAFLLRFSFEMPLQVNEYVWLIAVLIGTKLIWFHLLGLYRPILRYTGIEFLAPATKAVFCSSTTLVLIAYLFASKQLPRAVLVIDAILTLLLIVGARLTLRSMIRCIYSLSHTKHFQERVIIYGAGAAGSELAASLSANPHYRVIAFVDENASLHDHSLQGLPVYAPHQLASLQEKKPYDTILLALPNVDGRTKRRIIQELEELKVNVKTIPSISEIISGKISINKLRKVDITDLLGREQVEPHLDLLQMNITGKAVLVTGAGGSIGSELCRQIAQHHPRCLVLYELSEFALYNIDLELAERHPTLNRVSCLGSVTDHAYFSSVLRKYDVDTIYHAAAYKHVPLVESNPTAGIVNNVSGTLTAARCAIACQVQQFVLISSDKAVRPTNVMGATKRVAELILQGLAELPDHKTCFTMVRFGNVLDSSGSVVPRFRKLIAEGKPLTITHPEMTRYFMSIPEAASLVIQAGAMATGGEVFLLDMGEPVRIYDLAVQMIQLSGLELGHDIEIQITGLRPGEKIYEELLIDCSKARATLHPKIFCATEEKLSWLTLEPRLENLLMQAQLHQWEPMITELKRLVPGYQPAPTSQPISQMSGKMSGKIIDATRFT